MLLAGPVGKVRARVVDMLEGAGAAYAATARPSTRRANDALAGRAVDVVVALDTAADRLLALERDDGVPLIAVATASDPERAVRLMSAGAADCVGIRDLPRLVPVIEREIAAARVRRSLRALEAAAAARLSLALESADGGWWEWDLATAENVWSTELFRLYGLDPRTTRPGYEAWRSSIHPDDVAAAERAVQKAAAEGSELTAEWRVRTAEGGERRLLSRGRPILGADGRPARYLGIVLDVTERRRTEQALRDSERRRLAAQHAARIGEWEWNLRTGEVRWSAEIFDMSGMSPQSTPLSPDALMKVVHPDDAGKVGAALSRAVEEGVPADLEYRMVRGDGSIRVVHAVGVVTERDAEGRPSVMVGTNQDVTERKTAEAALRESEERLLLFVEHAPASLAMFDRDMRYLAASRRWHADFGLDFGTLLGRSHYEVFPDVPVRWREIHRRALAGEILRDDEDRFDRADGTTYWLRWEVRPWHTAGGEVGGIVIFAEDISARKRAESALRENEERLRAFFDSPVVGTLAGDVTGRVLGANDEFLRIVGYGRDDLEQGRIRWDTITPEEFLPLDLRGIAEAKARGSCTPYEKQYVRPDGSRVWVLVGFALTGPDRDGSVAFVLDISARKEAELELQRVNAQLDARVRERTASLEEANRELEAFAYSVSHDLRAPLRAIDGFSRLLLEEHARSLDQEGSRLLGVVRGAAQQMGRLIDDLLAFSRVGRSEMKRVTVHVRELVDDCWSSLAPSGDGRPQLVLGDLPDVSGDAALLRQVWFNLLSNAVKFSSRKEDARVEVGATRHDGEVVFSVADNGVGFDQKYVDKLFGVFQRLHRAADFPGTGVGLALVQRIVRRHGGRVWAEGRPGEGATFWLALPRSEGGE